MLRVSCGVAPASSSEIASQVPTPAAATSTTAAPPSASRRRLPARVAALRAARVLGVGQGADERTAQLDGLT
ncbi:hypothetical protein, partial [Streptomyces sp. NPDC003514]